MKNNHKKILEEKIRDFIDSEPVIDYVQNMVGFEKMDKLLIGGMIRDIHLGKDIIDLDFIIVGENGHFIVRELSKHLKRRYALLENKEDETYRIVSDQKTYDFTIITEKEFEQNIKKRDFTINAIAYDIGKSEIIDLTDGITDLNDNIIKATNEESLIDDPLRILRGIRFYSSFEKFNIEKKTLKLIEKSVPDLKKIAPERIREELLKIFQSKGLIHGLELFEKFNIKNVIFGEVFNDLPKKWINFIGRFNELKNSVATRVKRDPISENSVISLIYIYLMSFKIETLYKKDEECSYEIIHDIFRKLRFSNREIQFLKNLHGEIIELINILKKDGEIKDWKIRETIHKMQNDTVLVTASISFLATLFCSDELEGIAEKLNVFLAKGDGLYFPRLLDGEDLKSMGLVQGPEIGKILDKVKYAQYDLQIRTRQEAMNFVMEILDGDGN